MQLPPAVLAAILDGPALEPPKGVKPNFNSHDTLAIYIWPTVLLGLSLSTVFLILRIYTKHFITRSMSWEDCKFTEYPPLRLLTMIRRCYISLGKATFVTRESTSYLRSQVMLVGFGVPCCYCIRVGGRHQWDTSVRDLIDLLYVSPCQYARSANIINDSNSTRILFKYSTAPPCSQSNFQSSYNTCGSSYPEEKETWRCLS